MFARLALSLLACAALVRAQVLVDFQVAAPPNVPKNVKTCQITLVDHTFGASYYQPAFFNYSPPTGCGKAGSWAAVTLNLTVTSNGTQFDRLAIVTLNNTEIWRTSTPEPTRAGIIWTYTKDVTRYLPLFSAPSTFSMELNNNVDSTYTGLYATKVVATFYDAGALAPSAGKANLIIPIGTRDSTSQGAEVSVPPSFSEAVTFPRNAVAAYAELYASGNANEEFWYFNAPNQILPLLPSGETYGNGALREVRILVDGKLAGVALPYPVIFTGGIIPTAWRPITSYGALDLPTYNVDLSPFIPVLVDGKPHNITIDVASAEADHAINSNWYLSANIQVVTDSSSRPTTGKMTSYSAPLYATSSVTNTTNANGDVTFTLSASHQISMESTITSGSGHTTQVAWRQNVQFSNTQEYLNNYYTQTVKQTSSGSMVSLHNGVTALSDTFSFPLGIDYEVTASDGSSFNASFDHSYDRTVLPAPFVLGSTTTERQLAAGAFFETAAGNTGTGSSNNTLSYSDTKGGSYARTVSAVNTNITHDAQSGNLAPSHAFKFPWFGINSEKHAFAPARVPKLRRV